LPCPVSRNAPYFFKNFVARQRLADETDGPLDRPGSRQRAPGKTRGELLRETKCIVRRHPTPDRPIIP
jgi:hypothetical protein